MCHSQVLWTKYFKHAVELKSCSSPQGGTSPAASSGGAASNSSGAASSSAAAPTGNKSVFPPDPVKRLIDVDPLINRRSTRLIDEDRRGQPQNPKDNGR